MKAASMRYRQQVPASTDSGVTLTPASVNSVKPSAADHLMTFNRPPINSQADDAFNDSCNYVYSGRLTKMSYTYFSKVTISQGVPYPKRPRRKRIKNLTLGWGAICRPRSVSVG
jgi:hypothetical protein